MSQRTLAIIKPDAVERKLSGRIIQRIEDEGFTVRGMRRVNLSQAQASPSRPHIFTRGAGHPVPVAMHSHRRRCI